MGRAPCCEKKGLKKGQWSPEEDELLISYILQNGHPNWRALPKHAGLLRCGKSCRLRWINYLRPDIKRGNFSPDEQDTIIHLHQLLGNRWSAIAAKLPGRTDNEIKNVWHTHLKKRLPETDSHTTNRIDTKDSAKKVVRKRKATTKKEKTTHKKLKLEQENYNKDQNDNVSEHVKPSVRDSIILPPQPCGSEMSTITSTNGTNNSTNSTDTNGRCYASENETRGMENADEKDDNCGESSHSDDIKDDFWMEMLSIEEDTAMSTQDLSFVCDNPLLVEPIRFESSLNGDEVDVNLFWDSFFDKIQ